MLVNKKVKVSTGGKQVGEATIPLYPETVEDVVKVFKASPEIALKCLQNGLTIEYQRVLRNKFAVRESKPSKAKIAIIEKAKATGYYKEEYETMTVQAITNDIMGNLPKK